MRLFTGFALKQLLLEFPFLFGGTFIEALNRVAQAVHLITFPFLFGGTFIEAAGKDSVELRSADFPSFSEGLSLRPVLQDEAGQWMVTISLPFRRDFH